MAYKTKEEKQALIRNYRESGLTQTAWCKTNNFSIHSLRNWIKDIRKSALRESEPERISWVSVETEVLAEVKPAPVVPLRKSPCALLLRIGQAEIQLTEEFDPSLLRKVCQVLTSL